MQPIALVYHTMRTGNEQLPARISNLCFRCGREAQGQLTDQKGRRLCVGCADTATRPSNEVIDLGSDPALDTIPLAPRAETTITRAPCPNCNAAMKPGQTRCSLCGKISSLFEVQHGRRTAAEGPRTEPLRCKQCNYDLAGLRDLVCPECGTRNTVSSQSESLSEVSEEVTRWEYQKPAIMAAIGFVLAFLITGIDDGWSDAVWFAAGFPVRVTLITGAFIVCGLSWVGLDAPFKLTLLRFAGILGLVDLAAALLGASTLPFSGLLMFLGGGILYVYLLVELFDLDVQDAWGVAAVTYVVYSVLMVVMIWVLTIV